MWDIHAIYGDFLINNERFKEAVHMYTNVHLNLAKIPVENKKQLFNQITVSIALCQWAYFYNQRQ